MMDKDQLAGLGNEMMAMFEKLMEQEPRMEVPSQTGEAADLGVGRRQVRTLHLRQRRCRTRPSSTVIAVCESAR